MLITAFFCEPERVFFFVSLAVTGESEDEQPDWAVFVRKFPASCWANFTFTVSRRKERGWEGGREERNRGREGGKEGRMGEREGGKKYGR